VRAVEPDPRDVPVDLVLDRLGFDDRHDSLLGCSGSTSLSCGDAA
jgi:hypothetical protein